MGRSAASIAKNSARARQWARENRERVNAARRASRAEAKPAMTDAERAADTQYQNWLALEEAIRTVVGKAFEAGTIERGSKWYGMSRGGVPRHTAAALRACPSEAVMTITRHLARVAIRWLSRLADEPEAEEPDDEDALPPPPTRAELIAMALERQSRHPYRPMTLPPPPTAEETDSHRRYVQPKPKKPKKP